jgi:CheY-like chemotaxis protein
VALACPDATIVVEDEPIIREMTVEFLEEADLIVDQAASADERLRC